MVIFFFNLFGEQLYVFLFVVYSDVINHFSSLSLNILFLKFCYEIVYVITSIDIDISGDSTYDASEVMVNFHMSPLLFFWVSESSCKIMLISLIM
jgi:hypothetical protein